MTTEQKNKLMRFASVLSIGTAFLLAFIKGVTFMVTGSVAILSSLFDSIQDMMTSCVNLIAVREATTPADQHHRFGHGKAQALGGLFQGMIILGASLILLKESILRFFNPQPIREITLALAVTVIAIVLTFLLVTFQRLVVRKTNSLSIKADLAHYTGDILMNIGVAISILVSYFFQWNFMDALFGVLVAGYLMVSVYYVVRESLNMLMDAEISPEVRHNIKKLACSVENVYDCFDLKTRLSGNEMFAQFSVSLDDTLTLVQAHDKMDVIEEVIQQQYPDMHLIIHAEPVSLNKRSRMKN